MAESILVTRNIKKQYGKFTALNSVNISIEKGEQGRHKRIAVSGMSMDEVMQKIKGDK